jgi:hypothetical protein
MAKKKIVNKKNIKNKQKQRQKQVVNVKVHIDNSKKTNMTNRKQSQPVYRPNVITMSSPSPNPIYLNHIIKENDKPKVSLGSPIIPEIKESELITPLDRFKIYGDKDKNLLSKMAEKRIKKDDNLFDDEFDDLPDLEIAETQKSDILSPVSGVLSPYTEEIDDIYFRTNDSNQVYNPLTDKWIQDTKSNRKRILEKHRKINQEINKEINKK